MGKSGALLVVLMSGLTACAVGPNYSPPKEVIAQQQYVDATESEPLADIASQRWWTHFNDPVLNQWIEEGLLSNLDIAIAVERISAAEAALRGTGVNAAISGSLSASATASGARGVATTHSDSASVSGNFAIDLFGGIRRQRAVSRANLMAAIDDTETARLAYLSALVGAYVNARYYQYAMAMTDQSIDTRQRTLTITQRQRSVGSATEMDEAQVNALLYSAQADIPDLKASFMSHLYSIATLLNRPAADLLAEIEASSPTAEELLGLNLQTPYETGVPADLLRNRPDVRSAEQALKAAVAAIGVAKADRLPSLALNGTITDDNGSWSFGPVLSLPIFNQGALAAAQSEAESAAREAALSYRQTVLEAVENVQSTNSAWLRDREKVRLLRKSVQAYSRALELSMKTYRAGVMTLLDLLDTDRSLAAARLQYAAALRDLSSDWASLQIALGSGAGVDGP